jgi:hypothetical protein
MRQNRIIVVGWMLVLLSAAAAPLARKTFPEAVRGQIAGTLDQLQTDGDFAKAKVALIEVFDQVIAYATPRDTESFREADFALRLVGQLEKAPAASRTELLKYLRAHDNLALNQAYSPRPPGNFV